MMTLAEIHAVLAQVSPLLHGLRGELPDDIGDDTAFTLGRALGLFDKTRDLLARDIRRAAGNALVDRLDAPP